MILISLVLPNMVVDVRSVYSPLHSYPDKFAATPSRLGCLHVIMTVSLRFRPGSWDV